MARRDYAHSQNGQVYCVEWPEWHVNCELCEESVLVAGLGVCNTVREADRKMTQGGDETKATDWQKVNGLWRCPQHIES